MENEKKPISSSTALNMYICSAKCVLMSVNVKHLMFRGRSFIQDHRNTDVVDCGIVINNT